MKNTKAQKGFSLIEVMVASGIGMITLLAISYWFSNFMKDIKSFEDAVAIETESSLSSRSITGLFGKAGPSFNNLVEKDDSGIANFFDYYPDLPWDTFSATDRARVFTLTYGGTQTEFYYLSSLGDVEPAIMYEPSNAFEATAAPTVTTTPTLTITDGTLNYLDVDADLDPSVPGGATKILSNRFPTLWVEGALFAMTVPVGLRPITTDNVIDFKANPPRDSFLLGIRNGGKMERFTSNGPAIPNLSVIEKHPVTGNPFTGNNAENFLRVAPSVGGGTPIVKIEPVELLKLKIEPEVGSKPGTGSLYRYTFDGVTNTFTDKTLIAANVKKIELKRENIGTAVIRVNFTY